MLFPLGTDRRLTRPTRVTYWLLALNGLAFLWQFLYSSNDPEGYAQIERSLFLVRGDFQLHTLITYQFLHADIIHLLGNMLFLYVFGLNVEDRLGRVGFVVFYLAGGIVAGLAHIADSPSPVIGASGAISGVTGAFLVLFPRTRLKVLLMFFFIGVFWIPAWWLIALAIAKDLVFQGFGGSDNVARMAHLGGYVYGIAICLCLLWWKIIPRETYDLFSLGHQAKRRREFRELASKGNSPWQRDATEPVASKREFRKREQRNALDEAAIDERAQISSLIKEGQLDKAADRYEKAVGHFPEFSLQRGDLIALGNHLFKEARHELAALAYERMIQRHADDFETPRTMLMLALINARYLNDPVRAKQLIADVEGRPLDSQYEELLESLKQELG